MTASFITHATGDKVATETFTQSGVTVHLQKFLATNPAGQANAYGAGNADTATPRFTLATDDAAIAALIAAIGGISGGASYTEDAGAATNPAGGAVMLRRRDSLAGETSADGEWVAQNATNKGEAYVKDVDLTTALAATNTKLDAVNTKLDAANTSLDNIETAATDTSTPVKAVAIGAKVPANTITTTNGAYSQHDVVGGKLTFPNMARVSGGGGLLQSVAVAVKAAVTPNMELWLFDADPTSTSISDNGAWNLNAADLAKVFAVVSIATADWKDGGTPNVVIVEHVRKYTLGATSAYGYLVDRSGVTLASTSDVLVTLEAVQD